MILFKKYRKTLPDTKEVQSFILTRQLIRVVVKSKGKFTKEEVYAFADKYDNGIPYVWKYNEEVYGEDISAYWSRVPLNYVTNFGSSIESWNWI